MSVEVKNLTKVYGTQTAVNQLSFSANKGEVLGFLGPNGAGKTTTMKILTCFIPQTSGVASVCGFDVEKNPLEVRRQIGYLPEHNPLYKDMYVKEYLDFVANIYKLGNRRAKVADMIAQTGLGQEQNKRIGELSKGYRQRVGLAQAMIHDPSVLILDEPTSGLDPNQLVEIRQLIRNLGREKTVIFSTHIMQEVQAICDRVIIVNRGVKVADDHIEQLKAKMEGETILTVAFAQSVSELKLQKIKYVKRVKSLGNNTFQLIAAADKDIRADISKFVADNQLTLLEMKREIASMEDVFQKLTTQQ
jgi:ABC-2 type transport system ATP-binding protein